MGRNPGKGLHYFYIVTDWETKVKLVRAKFGLEGIGCLIALFQAIYKEGYSLAWEEDAELLFSDSNGIGIDRLKAIISFCVEKNIFDKGVFEKHAILTSHGIQKQWRSVSRRARRKETEVDPELSLLTADDLAEDGDENPELNPPGISARGKTISARGNPISARANATEQSRAEQMREEKNSSGGKSTGSDIAPPPASSSPAALPGDVQSLQDKIKRTPWPMILAADDLAALLASGADDGFIAYAIERTKRTAKSNPGGLFRTGLTKCLGEWIAEYRATQAPAKPSDVHVTFAPEPPPCECGGKIKADRREGTGKCVECGLWWRWDADWEGWEKDAEENRRATG